MIKIEVKRGLDGQPCCDVMVVKGNHYSEVKISEPIEELDRRRKEFLKKYFDKKGKK